MEFKRNRNGWLVSETHRQCTNCLEMFEKNLGNTMRICAKCNTARVKSQSATMKMYRRAKSRAKDKNLPFTIVPLDIVIPAACPILDLPLYCTTGASGAFSNSPSLDRIIPTSGYVPGNIRVISQQANAMKYNASPEHLLQFAKWVINNQSSCRGEVMPLLEHT